MRPAGHAGRADRSGRSSDRRRMQIGRVVIDVTPLRASRDFRWLFGGRFVSLASIAVALMAANWQIYALTRSSLAVGLPSLAGSAGMLVGLLAGEGLSFVRRSSVVGEMLLIDTNAMIFGMPTALFPALAASSPVILPQS